MNIIDNVHHTTNPTLVHFIATEKAFNRVECYFIKYKLGKTGMEKHYLA